MAVQMIIDSHLVLEYERTFLPMEHRWARFQTQQTLRYIHPVSCMNKAYPHFLYEI